MISNYLTNEVISNMTEKINDCSTLFHENGKENQNVNSTLNKHWCKQNYNMYSKLSKEQLS